MKTTPNGWRFIICCCAANFYRRVARQTDDPKLRARYIKRAGAIFNAGQWYYDLWLAELQNG